MKYKTHKIVVLLSILFFIDSVRAESFYWRCAKDEVVFTVSQVLGSKDGAPCPRQDDRNSSQGTYFFKSQWSKNVISFLGELLGNTVILKRRIP